MASELLRIWSSTPGTTVMFITHSIPEAILLSDRVVVMSARPGRVTRIVDIDLPRPRTEEVRESAAFYELDTELRRLLIEGGAARSARRRSGRGRRRRTCSRLPFHRAADP
jgi:NitT/TauT family transport system ATP-binding protein